MMSSPREVYMIGETAKLTSLGKVKLTGEPWSEAGVTHRGDEREGREVGSQVQKG